jgi:DNA-binding NarL/FixJ family response regulator
VQAQEEMQMAERLSGRRRIRVLVADGERLVRAGLRALLEGEPDITVAAEAGTGEQALVQAAGARPAVAVIDGDLPGLDGVECARRMRADGLAVLMLLASESDERVLAALRAGASGLLLRDAEADELVRAVRIVAGGGAVLGPGITRRVIAELVATPAPGRPRPERLRELTAREREVMALVACGLSNREIAERLVVSPATAKTHVSRALVKLDARDRAQLVVLAYEAGLVLPGRRPPAPARAPALAHLGLRPVAA